MTCNLDHLQYLKDKAKRLGTAVANPRFMQPMVLQAHTSDIPLVKDFGAFLVPDGLDRTTVEAAKRIPAYIQVSKVANEAEQIRQLAKEEYIKSRGYSTKGPLVQERAFAKAKATHTLTLGDFNAEVSNAQFQKMVNPDFVHENSHVEKVANMYIEKVYKKGLEDAQKAGLLKEGELPKGYLSIQHNESAWRTLMDDKVNQLAADELAEHPEHWSSIKEAQDYIRSIRDGFRVGQSPEADLNVIGQQMHLWGSETDASLATRSKLLDPTLLNKYGLLHRDAIGVAHGWQLRMSRMIEFKKVLTDLGFKNTTELRQAIQEQAKQLLTETERRMKLPSSDPLHMPEGSLEYVQSNVDHDLQLTDDMQRAFMGTLDEVGLKYRTPVKIVKTLTSQAALGGVSLSQLNDFAQLPFRQGYLNTFKHGYLPLIKNLFTPGSKLFTANGAELRRIGAAAEIEMNDMMTNLVNPEGTLDSLGKVRNATEWANGMFGKLTGLTYLNNFHEKLAGTTAFGRLMDMIKNNHQFDNLDEMALRQAGIEHKDLLPIYREWKKAGGNMHDSLHQINIAAWEEGPLKDKVSRYLYNEVHGSLSKPNPLDKPAWMGKGVIGQLASQFQGFTAVTQTRILQAAIDRHDATAMIGIFNMVLLGYTTYAIKEILAGREPSTDITTVLSQGIARTGINTLMTSYLWNLNPWTRGGRYGQDDILSQIIPAVGYVNTAFKGVTGILADASADPTDIHNLRKIVPYQNLFYFQATLDKIEKAINDSKLLQRDKSNDEPPPPLPKPRWK